MSVWYGLLGSAGDHEGGRLDLAQQGSPCWIRIVAHDVPLATMAKALSAGCRARGPAVTGLSARG